MGTTGSSASIAINNALPDIISRVREYSKVPIAVGFGVATRDQFDFVANAGADGVVIGSRLVSIIKNAPGDQIPQSVETYCSDLSQKSVSPRLRYSSGIIASDPAHNTTDEPPFANLAPDNTTLPARFGQFGGQYVAESLFDCLVELEAAHKSATKDPTFWKEFESFYGYMNRPSNLYLAEKLTSLGGGANIWLKREDLYVQSSQPSTLY
jgi:tryptophan synthase